MVFNFMNNEKVEGSGYVVNYTLSEKTESEEIRLLKEQNELLRKQLDILLSKV